MIQLFLLISSERDGSYGKDLRSRKMFNLSSFTKCCICPGPSLNGGLAEPVGQVPSIKHPNSKPAILIP